MSARRGRVDTYGALRARLYSQLDPTARAQGLSLLNIAVAVLIVVATVVAIASTEPDLVRGRERHFAVIDVIFGAIFGLEYVARVWVAPENPHFRSRFGRIHFALTPAAIIDLIVLAVTLAPFIAGNVLPLRILRLVSIVRIAKLGRLSSAMRHLAAAVSERRYELALTAMFALVGMVVGATLMWWAEGDVQPDKFGSIPRALWWAAVTLTTIGYGDVYPITALGKALSVGLAVLGIGQIGRAHV